MLWRIWILCYSQDSQQPQPEEPAFPGVAPEHLQNRPADSSTDESNHKHSRSKHARILSMQAEKKGNSAKIPADFKGGSPEMSAS